jgi:hypothetical protein
MRHPNRGVCQILFGLAADGWMVGIGRLIDASLGG